MRAPSAGTARRWSAPRTSRRRISALPLRASRRSSSCASIPRRAPRRPPSPPSGRRPSKLSSGEGDELGVVLVRPLELEEVVVPAARAVGILAAYRRPRLVHGAAALVLVEVYAHRVEHLVLLVA